MRRTLLAFALLLPACGDSSDGDTPAPAVAVERHAPPPAGQSGATLTYPGGHPLDWITGDAAVLDYEDQVLARVNQHRTSMGLLPLVTDDGLRACARGHSRHMFVHAFVAHVNPEGHGPGDRIGLCGVPGVVIFGENAAGGPATPADVVRAWLASPGHRATIEVPTFRRTGVGYQPGPDGDAYGHYWTQLFAN